MTGGRGINGNVKPGLVVDRGVTSPYSFDFYIQSHAAVQGQARPAHYIVLHDDTKTWNAKKLQRTVCVSPQAHA